MEYQDYIMVDQESDKFSDSKENNGTQKKLTLRSSKLSLEQSINIAQLKQNYITGSKLNTITVEVKTNRVVTSSSTPSFDSTFKKQNDLTDVELKRRLEVLRKSTEISQASIEDLSPSDINVDLVDQENDSLEDLPDNQLPEKKNVEVEEDTSDIVKAPDHLEGRISAVKLEAGIEENAVKKHKINSKKTYDSNKYKQGKSAFLGALKAGFNDDESGKRRSLAAIKRAKEKERRRLNQEVKPAKIYREILIPELMTVGDLAHSMTEKVADVIRALMKLGIVATTSQVIDADTVEVIVSSFGHTAKRIKEQDVDLMIKSVVDEPNEIKPRPPVVTVMGHVDHGKTSLLDALKSTDVVGQEFGGITQHIGAYQVHLANDLSITFIDTPGHEAFTEMRARGVKLTDIVVLVVAADDGIKAQTIEAINHAKAASLPIVVAINKIDKPSANVEKVKRELLNYGLISEDLGGDVIMIPVSALQGTNLDKLEEAILLVAEMLDLKSNPESSASGVIIEAKMDANKGVIITALVQRGTLSIGNIIVAGAGFGRVKRMINDKGQSLEKAGLSVPVEILGLDQVPRAGDQFMVVQTERQAKSLAENLAEKLKIQKNSSLVRLKLEDMLAGPVQEVPLILKVDVHGSLEAIKSSIGNISSNTIKPKILHAAVGGIIVSDVMLAKASSAVILGFNVRAVPQAALLAERDKVDIRYYSIIYKLLDDLKAIMNGMLAPVIREQYLGTAEVREVFNITKVGKVGGCYVTKGLIRRGSKIRLLRDSIIIFEGNLKTLKRFKEDLKEARENFECGIGIENYEDIKVGDVIECFDQIEERNQLF